ncbi:MAG: M20/M25/M40 family metallo-hydrolase [Ruminococcaceae bacterium]|nr:M20/M25/M40 family metallo-hydrolase [Oscillospiraceae bacterium]
MGLKILYGILIVLGAFIVLTLIRAAFYKPKKSAFEPLPEEKVDLDRYMKNLQRAISIPTVSYATDEEYDWRPFEEFHSFLEEAYPLFHKTLKKENVSKASLLYTWEGKNPSLDPIALLSHQDVVPDDEKRKDEWEHPAFEGHNDGEFIWGRGALDMKNHLIGVMESVEALIAEGFEPERTVYICFAHDEEPMIQGGSGADTICGILRDRGVHLDCILDEGGAILPVNVKGLIENKYLAGIGVAEKGYADYRISINGHSGHSSQPPKHTALGKMAKVIRKIENHQFKAHLSKNMYNLFTEIGRNASYPVRLFACNLWLLKPLVTKIMTLIPPAASMVRTTTAVTMAEGSPAANVLPGKAVINVNFRIMQGDSVEGVKKHILKYVGKKIDGIEFVKGKEPSYVSPTDSRCFNAIREICDGTSPDYIVAPYLVMGGTDACKYEGICENIYRFSPFVADTSLLLRTHNTNERIPVSSLEGGVTFFKRYIKKLAGE